MSLHGAKGAKRSKIRQPSDAEGLALAVGGAMQWGRLRTSSHPMFFTNVSAELKRLRRVCVMVTDTHASVLWYHASVICRGTVHQYSNPYIYYICDRNGARRRLWARRGV